MSPGRCAEAVAGAAAGSSGGAVPRLFAESSTEPHDERILPEGVEAGQTAARGPFHLADVEREQHLRIVLNPDPDPEEPRTWMFTRLTEQQQISQGLDQTRKPIEWTQDQFVHVEYVRPELPDSGVDLGPVMAILDATATAAGRWFNQWYGAALAGAARSFEWFSSALAGLGWQTETVVDPETGQVTHYSTNLFTGQFAISVIPDVGEWAEAPVREGAPDAAQAEDYVVTMLRQVLAAVPTKWTEGPFGAQRRKPVDVEAEVAQVVAHLRNTKMEGSQENVYDWLSRHKSTHVSFAKFLANNHLAPYWIKGVDWEELAALDAFEAVIREEARRAALIPPVVQWTSGSDYIDHALGRIFIGDYSETDVNAAGVVGSIAFSLTGFDVYKDVADIAYGVQHWEWTWGNAANMGLNTIGVLPLLGMVKNLKHADEFGAIRHLRHADDVLDQTKHVDEGIEALKRFEGAGDYKSVGGHHPHAKRGFVDAAGYYPEEAFALSDALLQRYGILHARITPIQMRLFRELAKSGLPNNLTQHTRIAYKALVEAGMPKQDALAYVAESLRRLIRAGVVEPTKMPWNPKWTPLGG